ncbi:thioester reductase domain-containing protein [Janthinobacterium fluminis]|uniref:Thioester reductase domain-containing protein n=1 Tax=Janthinobacterium fluminis TaxID=2987524 RepID=A0ABT5K040_9BURK|nr:thioester reductase domain-containing protein [Janthinobacterium fluminis]MDC8758070.1 thioester reductase domain-containing protein [Janthinobacterium fluminis]
MNQLADTTVKNILLTGATGVLGGRLLQEVLSATGAEVHCVVRAADAVEARRRIEEVLFSYDEQGALKDQAWRIRPVLGDVSLPQFGLADAAYAELAGAVDLALHCAANVSLVASYAKIAPVNVGGAANVVEFCLAAGAPLLYTSSFSVVGDKLYEDGFVLKETDLDVGQGFEDMAYERSKFDAERLVQEAGARGLEWVIVRPGNIWGDSRTGCYPLKQTKVKGIYYEMLKALVETGLSFKSDEDFDISPVDYVAKAALFAALNLPATRHRTYNLTSPAPISYDAIVEQVRGYGYRVDAVETRVYFEALQEGRISRAGKPYRSTFTDLMSIFYDGSDCKERAKYDTRKIDALLAGSDIVCHASDATLMARYLDYAIRSGFIAAPREQQPLAQISAAAIRGGGYMESLYDADLSEVGHVASAAA